VILRHFLALSQGARRAADALETRSRIIVHDY
jgi:hypothetical protein